jgi:hypothetical protein
VIRTFTVCVCDWIALLSSIIVLLIVGVMIVSFVKNDPDLFTIDPKRLFFGVMGLLIIVLTCAGIRSLYNEENTKVRGSNEGAN